MTKSDYLDHAVHNEKTCDYLELAPDPRPNDWIVTTAFYSALHFVNFKLFPLTKHYPGGITKTFKNLEEYKQHEQSIGSKKNHHRTTIYLTGIECPDNIADCYKWLFDTCRTARYNNFHIDNSIAQSARAKLLVIKRYCITN